LYAEGASLSNAGKLLSSDLALLSFTLEELELAERLLA